MAAAAAAAAFASAGLVEDTVVAATEAAPTAWPAQIGAGDDACMGESAASTSAVQLQCSVSAIIDGASSEVTMTGAHAPDTLGAGDEGRGGACTQPAAVHRGAPPAGCTADAAAVSALLAAEDVRSAIERVPTLSADGPEVTPETGTAAAAASAGELVPEDEAGADVLFSSAAAMIAAVADGIASKLQACLLPWHSTQIPCTSLYKPTRLSGTSRAKRSWPPPWSSVSRVMLRAGPHWGRIRYDICLDALKP